MKTMNAIIILVLLILVGCEGAGPGSNEVPITTSNDEALQFYLDGRDLSEKVKGPQAAELYDKAIASDPDFAMAYLSRAFSGGGYDVYRKNFAKAVELIDKVSPGEKHLILYYQAGADNDDAKQTAELDTLLNMYPEDKRIQTLAGNYYRFEQNNEKALGHFNRAVELDPDYAFGYNLLGYMHIAMGNFEEAEAAFKKYISLTPDEANPYDSYAEFLLNQGRFEESLDQYKKALEVDPEFNFAYYGIGNSYDLLKEYGKARDTFQELFDKAQNVNQKVGALFSMSVSYVFEGDFNNAVEALEKRAGLGEKENMPGTVFYTKLWIANLLDETGKFDDAALHYDELGKYIETADVNESARATYRMFLGLDRCYHKILMGELDEADKNLAECQKLVEERGNQGATKTFNLYKGMYEAGRKNFTAALEYYKDSYTDSPYVWFCEGAAHEMAGNKEEAEKCYQKVIDCNRHTMGLAVVRERAKEKLS